MTMVEKVARAIEAKHYTENYNSMAIAAIEAMRESTREMKAFGASKPIYHMWGTDGEFTDDESAGEIYQRMIDMALKE